MKNLMKLMALAMALLVPGEAFAAAVTSVRKSLNQTRDASGYPIAIDSDRPWKVFEVRDTIAETQVTDEDGKTPTGGVLHKVCVESAANFPLNTDWVLVWDSAAATGTQASGRRLLPPITRASAADKCSDIIDAVFTRGLRVQHGSVNGASYIYWRELGAYR